LSQASRPAHLRLGFFNYRGERFGVVHRQVREHFSAEADLLLGEVGHELRISGPVEAGSGVDPYDPKSSELPLSLAAVTVLVLKGFVYRVFSYGIDFTASAPIAFCLIKNLPAAASGSHAIRRSWHFPVWLFGLSVYRFIGLSVYRFASSTSRWIHKPHNRRTI
jgi:hypothetical protein